MLNKYHNENVCDGFVTLRGKSDFVAYEGHEEPVIFRNGVIYRYCRQTGMLTDYPNEVRIGRGCNFFSDREFVERFIYLGKQTRP